MASPAKPWWQLFLDGHASEEGLPAFIGGLGVAPVDWDAAGSVRLRWTPPPSMRTPGGWVQGGFLGVVLDMAQTIAVFTQLPDGMRPMTLEMKISFIETSLADTYIVTARALRVGRHVAHTDGAITLEDGALVATSTATHVVRATA